MRVGFVGLGKLGYPLALVADAAGHEVYAKDTNPLVRVRVTGRSPIDEADSDDLIGEHRIQLLDSSEPFLAGTLIFVVVQTPHRSEFDGSRFLTDDRHDFETQGLRHAVDALPDHCVPIVVSTVLPGTLRRWRRPVIYNPSFCAMGTTIADARDPEFVLVGHDGRYPELVVQLRRYYETIHSAPVIETDVTTAEGIKVLYNGFITAKVTLANLYGELAERVGMNADHIADAFTLATRRISSPAYLRSGMSDGGPCHPRDNLALSWLAREHDLSYDIFGALLEARQAHVEWLASIIPDGAVLFGTAYKPDSKITLGSGALLLASALVSAGKRYRQDEDPTPGDFNVIATAHSRYRTIRWPEGSTVLDPFGIIEDQEGVTVRRLGRP